MRQPLELVPRLLGKDTYLGGARETITYAIGLGGGTDSVASMAGRLLGAYSGIVIYPYT